MMVRGTGCRVLGAGCGVRGEVIKIFEVNNSLKNHVRKT